ncbi:MAG: hypothetical protein JWQ86_5543 [Mycobacterium sp.]|jgi:hypothetical protein|nr:hypothetical protein [Mycobacterium sp.]MDT5214621.1 hypothetical protein [Mycobacterium sp.]MDT5248285.1 hypothetical protein [Mycobacterium sp.]MDT5400826.1 hypothetical protein [Mycobacterium sp.]MDT7758832.1 hypothetical protein [Mycobacterium sp.]
MGNPDVFKLVVIDGPTASALSQILPLLLLTLMVELRRTALHRTLSRALVGVCFFVFGVIETVLVLSIDGMLYPFQWGDLLSALTIFSLLTLIFVISFIDTGSIRRGGQPDASADEDL